MEKPPQVFTVEGINALVPRLNDLVGRQIDRRSVIENKLRDLATLTGEVPEAIVLGVDDPMPVADLKKELMARIDEYQTGWRELEDMGIRVSESEQGHGRLRRDFTA